MADVYIKYSELKELDEHLKNIITELKEASNRADVLEHAIGNPFGRDNVREAAEEFEDGWDDRRKKLAGDIEEVEQHVAGVVKGFEDWDAQTTQRLSQATSGPTGPSGPR